MRKIFVFAIAMLIAGSAGATCITFDTFCDQLEINIGDTGGTKSLSGGWDFDCSGLFPANALGTVNKGLGTFCSGDVFGGGNPFCFAITPTGGGACTFDLYQHDGAGGTLLYQNDAPCTINPGSCVIGARGGVPSVY